MLHLHAGSDPLGLPFATSGVHIGDHTLSSMITSQMSGASNVTSATTSGRRSLHYDVPHVMEPMYRLLLGDQARRASLETHTAAHPAMMSGTSNALANQSRPLIHVGSSHPSLPQQESGEGGLPSSWMDCMAYSHAQATEAGIASAHDDGVEGNEEVKRSLLEMLMGRRTRATQPPRSAVSDLSSAPHMYPLTLQGYYIVNLLLIAIFHGCLRMYTWMMP